jgi:hypothetical protein
MLILGLLAIVVGLLLAVSSGRRRVLRAVEGPVEVEPLAIDEEPPPTEDAEVVAVEVAPPRELRLGDTYTRAEIRALFGGGPQDYLPHVGGRVVCGCFHPGYNPYAPVVVLPGPGRAVQRWAMAFAAQGDAVPCFLKRGARSWEYVGDFRVAHLSRDPDEIDEWARIAEREGDVSMVLHLEEARADEAESVDAESSETESSETESSEGGS